MPDRAPAIIGSKFVVPRLGYRNFWSNVSYKFHVCIWSCMKLGTVKQIVDFLFGDLQSPAYIFGQEHCSIYRDRRGVVMRSPENIRSLLFQKNLNTLWWPPRAFDDGALYSSENNTILIDDNPSRSAVNPDCNGIFPKPFQSNKSPDANIGTALQPFFDNLFNTSMQDIRDHVIRHRFGQQPLPYGDPIKMIVLNADFPGNTSRRIDKSQVIEYRGIR